MTENEKRILTLLNTFGPLTKPELCKKGHMGWATVVKLINRLLESGYINHAGIFRRSSGQGKNPEIFKLSSTSPLAVGVDVEYKQTTIVLTNLQGTILERAVVSTPENLDVSALKIFLAKNISIFVNQNISKIKSLSGIGIGLPGIGRHTWIDHRTAATAELSRFLELTLSTKVSVDINVRVYAVFEKWKNRAFLHEDFLLLSIRSGIGSGIFLNGSLYYGHQDHAGEIGHMTVKENGKQCVCGRIGCLQTEVNQNSLYDQYLKKVLNEQYTSLEKVSQKELLKNLPDLFTRAKEGEISASQIIQQAVLYLGRPVADTLLVLNIPHIIISGHFGVDGDIIVRPLEEEIRKRILSHMDFTVSYVPLEERGFTLGASLLIMRDYFTDIPV